jgi:predicted transcriptional regulator
MGAMMKTTIEIQDDLMKAAKALARKQGTTLRSIVERGIRTTLNVERDATHRSNWTFAMNSID